MLVDILQSFWLGFAITAIPGAVFFEILRRSVHEPHSVRMYLAGNFVGMLLLICVAFAGLRFVQSDFADQVLYALSGIVLLYIGLRAIQAIPHSDAPKRKQSSDFGMGFVLAAANPLAFVFWVAMTGNYLAETDGLLVPVVYTSAVVAGSFAVCLVLYACGRRLGHRLSASTLGLLSKSFGVILCCYGAVTLARVFT